ncbi:MAG: hypothetical protein LUG61_06790 [Lachnospiraceae bacterium]|nr:hypothetical protein [Lachnospiraceae bacterium]
MNYMDILKTYAGRMLKEASYPQTPSSLLADKVDARTHVPLEEEDGHIVSNAAHQQNFVRFLCGLSALTGESFYEERALSLMRYMLDRPMEGGLLRWGGHRYLDLKTLTDRGEKGFVHELKNDYPDYELMFQADPAKAELYIKSFWNAHVYDFDAFEMGRHSMEKPYGVEGIWERRFGDPPALMPRKGLSFRNTGNDLMYAAGKLWEQKEDQGALTWAEHIFGMYQKSRHPKTHLGAYMFSQAEKQMDTDDDTITLSMYGDRAKRQLGPEFGDAALEAWVLRANQEQTIYAMSPQIIAACYSHGSETEKRIVDGTVENMRAFARYAWDGERQVFRPLLADGTDLTGFELKRPGYYGPKGRVIESHRPAGDYLLAWVGMALLTEDEELWKIEHSLEKALGLTDEAGRPNENCACTDSGVLLALIKLCEHGHMQYLPLAEKIAENIVSAYYVDGYFRKKDSTYARLNTIEPLALLKLEALKAGIPGMVADPIYGRSSGCE